MTVRLLVLRHAKSSWADEYTDDWERPLTDRGVRDATRVGQLLRRLSLVPDVIVSSDAVRAQTTAQLVADAAGYTGKISLSPALYHAKPQVVIDVLRKTPRQDAPLIMVVAHNPSLEDLVAQLTGEHVGLSTATLVHLQLRAERWGDLEHSKGAGVIDVWHPGDH
jgi:phosphohistidine phosphatase